MCIRDRPTSACMKLLLNISPNSINSTSLLTLSSPHTVMVNYFQAFTHTPHLRVFIISASIEHSSIYFIRSPAPAPWNSLPQSLKVDSVSVFSKCLGVEWRYIPFLKGLVIPITLPPHSKSYPCISLTFHYWISSLFIWAKKKKSFPFNPFLTAL